MATEAQNTPFNNSSSFNSANDKFFDISSSSFTNIEFADDHKRAIVTIPLMHVGPNKKGLYWTAKILEEIAPMFRGTVFKYDIQGQEGSSHVLKKLFSPFYDVGWTYDGADGAWYDNKTHTLWVKGEVTHPEVVQKLERVNSKGKRELNFASMGVLVKLSKCSICGHEEGDCQHVRLEKYDGRVCYGVPEIVAKALHVALTNDPADGEAEIEKCIFQELGAQDFRMSANRFENQKAENKIKSIQNINDKVVNNMNEGKGMYTDPNTQTRQDNMHEQMGAPSEMRSNQFLQNQLSNGMAPGQPQTNHPGSVLSPEELLRSLAERIKTIEDKVSMNNMQAPAPELINSAPQDQFTQDNMGVTEQIDQQEESKMDLAKGQNTQSKTPVNPSAVETQDEASMDTSLDQQILAKLDQILARLPQIATQDVDELINAGKEKAKSAQEDIPTEHKASPASGGKASSGAEAVSKDAENDESNKKNKAFMKKPGEVATADNLDEASKLKIELADMKQKVAKMEGKLEFQETGIPEFGGSASETAGIEVADMTADERTKNFGTFGAFEAIFKGPQSAQKFKR